MPAVDLPVSDLVADALRRYDIVDGVVADEPRTPHNFPGIDDKNCTAEELTNGTEVTSRYINGGRPWVSSRPGGACWARFVDRCEDKHLAPWRNEERKKTVAKLFTSLFVLVGIGILGEMTSRKLRIGLQPAERGGFVAGSVGGAFGSEISSLMHRICLSSVNVVFNAATEPLGITHVPDKVFAMKRAFFLTKRRVCGKDIGKLTKIVNDCLGRGTARKPEGRDRLDYRSAPKLMILLWTALGNGI